MQANPPPKKTTKKQPKTTGWATNFVGTDSAAVEVRSFKPALVHRQSAQKNTANWIYLLKTTVPSAVIKSLYCHLVVTHNSTLALFDFERHAGSLTAPLLLSLSFLI